MTSIYRVLTPAEDQEDGDLFYAQRGYNPVLEQEGEYPSGAYRGRNPVTGQDEDPAYAQRGRTPVIEQDEDPSYALVKRESTRSRSVPELSQP